jgi:hypothetical protein
MPTFQAFQSHIHPITQSPNARLRRADPLMLLRPDPLRTERALVDTALSVVKDRRVSQATSIARDLISSRNHRLPPTHPDAGVDPPLLAGEHQSQPPKLAPNRNLSPAVTNPRLRIFRGWHLLLGDQGFETGGMILAEGPLASNPYPKAFRVSTSWDFPPERCGVSLAPPPSLWQSEILPLSKKKCKGNFSPGGRTCRSTIRTG